ncbi:hypothetical protein CDIK_0843 [Cucumispora dikerogammari]|nr:hypothetical protein CDIK_0843 [Cucumispora dikerogammari]
MVQQVFSVLRNLLKLSIITAKTNNAEKRAFISKQPYITINLQSNDDEDATISISGNNKGKPKDIQFDVTFYKEKTRKMFEINGDINKTNLEVEYWAPTAVKGVYEKKSPETAINCDSNRGSFWKPNKVFGSSVICQISQMKTEKVNPFLEYLKKYPENAIRFIFTLKPAGKSNVPFIVLKTVPVKLVADNKNNLILEEVKINNLNSTTISQPSSRMFSTNPSNQ